jgi:phosphodiesterase/alkaline phosphatase D-like protein
MTLTSRRLFLGTSFAAFSAACLIGDDKPSTSAKKAPPETPFNPDTLFLTWQRDPTTTMTVQWIGAAGETADTNVAYATLKTESWQTKMPKVRPYPRTDLKVFRAELTGLKPGTDYRFRIGKESPTYRFRTMPAKATMPSPTTSRRPGKTRCSP